MMGSMENQVKNNGLIPQLIKRIADMEEFIRKHQALQHGNIPASGWVSASEIWTFATPFTFTTPGNTTAKYQAGTKLIYVQNSTTKYSVVYSSSYNSTTAITTVTIIVSTDYALANATITGNSYSYIENPAGWPDWFNYAPTNTGFSILPTAAVYAWSAKGRTMTVNVRQTGAGTSNLATFTISLPCQAATITNGAWQGVAAVINNGANVTTAARIRILTGATVMDIFSDFFNAGFAIVNAKSVSSGSIVYQF